MVNGKKTISITADTEGTLNVTSFLQDEQIASRDWEAKVIFK